MTQFPNYRVIGLSAPSFKNYFVQIKGETAKRVNVGAQRGILISIFSRGELHFWMWYLMNT